MTKGISSQGDIDSHIWIKDIQENDQIQGLYMVKNKRLGLTKKGDHFLSLTLADRSGDVETRVWDNAERLSSQFSEGDIIKVEGYASSYRNRIQLTLSTLNVSKDEIDPSLFLETASSDSSKMMRALKRILNGIKDPHLIALNEKFLSDRKFTSQFKKAPAAKNFHHGYVGGLLEHTLSVCQMAQKVADHYPELDRDLLITGALLHDIGKVKEFKYDKHIDYTDEGRLLGHLVMGVSMLEEKLSDLKDFPQNIKLKLNHMILSHHGEYDFGSPKRPKFLEAFALHLIDDLDAKIKGLGRFMEKDQQEGSWTDYNRIFERYFLKGSINDDPKEETEQTLQKDDGQKVLFSP